MNTGPPPRYREGAAASGQTRSAGIRVGGRPAHQFQNPGAPLWAATAGTPASEGKSWINGRPSDRVTLLTVRKGAHPTPIWKASPDEGNRDLFQHQPTTPQVAARFPECCGRRLAGWAAAGHMVSDPFEGSRVTGLTNARYADGVGFGNLASAPTRVPQSFNDAATWWPRGLATYSPVRPPLWSYGDVLPVQAGPASLFHRAAA